MVLVMLQTQTRTFCHNSKNQKTSYNCWPLRRNCSDWKTLKTIKHIHITVNVHRTKHMHVYVKENRKGLPGVICLALSSCFWDYFYIFSSLGVYLLQRDQLERCLWYFTAHTSLNECVRALMYVHAVQLCLSACKSVFVYVRVCEWDFSLSAAMQVALKVSAEV